MNAAATTHTHCLRCGRTLTSAKSQAAGYGPTCARHIRRAAVDLTEYKPHQVTSARELIEDGAIVPLRSVVFIAVSSDGTETYKTAPTACSCPAGLKGSRCYHTLAARLLLAA
jgi:ribosomal protein L37E